MKTILSSVLILLLISACGAGGGSSSTSSSSTSTSTSTSTSSTVVSTLTFPVDTLYLNYIKTNRFVTGVISGTSNNRTVSGTISTNDVYSTGVTVNLPDTTFTGRLKTYTNLNRVLSTVSGSLIVSNITSPYNNISTTYLTSSNQLFMIRNTTTNVDYVVSNLTSLPTLGKVGDSGQFYTSNVYNFVAYSLTLVVNEELCGLVVVNYSIEADTATSVILKLTYIQTRNTSFCQNNNISSVTTVDSYRLTQTSTTLISSVETTTTASITTSY